MNPPALPMVATLEGVRALGDWLEHGLSAHYPQFVDRRGELELALHELVVNVVDHAYGGGRPDAVCTLTMSAEAGSLEFTCTDEGVPYQAPEVQRELGGEPGVRGYGLLIIEQLASSITYRRDQNRNVWQVVFAPTVPSERGICA